VCPLLGNPRENGYPNSSVRQSLRQGQLHPPSESAYTPESRLSIVPEARVSMQSEPNTPQTPFQINVADRVRRLPPYLFGKINELKYRKRRAGIDIIDLGMGNPTDVPDPLVIEKLCEAAHADNNHRYSVSSATRNR